jgi:thioesterase domain-containing protein
VALVPVPPNVCRATLSCAHAGNRSYRDPTLGWRNIALGGVDIVWTPGNHETMFTEGNVEEFGQLLQEVLEKHTFIDNPAAT